MVTTMQSRPSLSLSCSLSYLDARFSSVSKLANMFFFFVFCFPPPESVLLCPEAVGNLFFVCAGVVGFMPERCRCFVWVSGLGVRV
jgi:hypothetical protein